MMLGSIIDHLGNHLDVLDEKRDFRNVDFSEAEVETRVLLVNSSFEAVALLGIALCLMETRVVT